MSKVYKVAVCCYEKQYEKLRAAFEEQDSYPDSIHFDSGLYTMYWERIKWLNGWYEDITAFENILKTMDIENYKFIRMGEEDGDVDVRGNQELPITFGIDLGLSSDAIIVPKK